MVQRSHTQDEQLLKDLNVEIGDAENRGDREWPSAVLAPRLALLIGNRFGPSGALARSLTPKACVSMGAE